MGWKDGSLLTSGGNQSPGADAPASTNAQPQQSAPSNSGPPQSGWRSGQPLSQPSAPAAATAPSPAAQPAPSWNDYLLQHLAGVGQGIHNASRAVDDFLTFGGADAAQSYLPTVGGGQDPFGSQPTGPQSGDRLAQLRAQTQAAHQGLGWFDPVLGAATYAAGPGELRIASSAADAARALTGGSKLAGWTGGVLGSGAEGAAASAAGTAGHGGSWDDALSAAKWGGGIGALTGAIGVGSAKNQPDLPVGKPPAAPSTASLDAAVTPAYDVAGDHLYDNADVRQAMANARNEIDQQPRRVTRGGQGAFDQISAIENEALGKGAQSAEDLNDFIKKLHVNQTGDDVPTAGMIAQKHLNGILDQGAPITGQGVGSGRVALADANQAYQRSANAGMLDEWQRQAALPGSGGPGEVYPAGARAALKSDPQFYGPAETDALSTLGRVGTGVMPSYYARHLIAPGLGVAVGAGAGAFGAVPGNPWERVPEEMAVGGLAGLGYSKGMGALTRGAAQNAFNNARQTLTTGWAPPQIGSDTPLRDAIRNIIFSQGGQGRF
jgi:hypothetical protein